MMENFDFPEKTNQSHNIEEFEKINPQKNTVYQWRRHYVRENKKVI